jgi:hypothetical protein
MTLCHCDAVSLREKFSKIIGGNYCKNLEIFVPLQCQMKEVAEAAIKDKHCEI